METYSTVLSFFKKDYFITSMSCYIDLVVDVPKLSQFDNIKKIQIWQMQF